MRGFDIGNVWEGVVAHWGNKDVKILNNYIHDTGKRAIWSLGSERTQAAHNFIENAGGDGFDWDALTTENIAYENLTLLALKTTRILVVASRRFRNRVAPFPSFLIGT